MKSRFTLSLLTALVLCRSISADDLSIDPVQQETPEWCWLAAGEMIFKYYEIPNVNPAGIYQCGIVGVIVGGPCAMDCRYCSYVPAGTISGIRNMIVSYPRFVRSLLHDKDIKRLTAHVASHALSDDEVRDEIDAGRPIIAGISPLGSVDPASPQHAVLIIGYDGDDDSMDLTVNDPFPYGSSDPYTAVGGNGGEGQYTISYKRFKNRLHWTASLYGIDEP